MATAQRKRRYPVAKIKGGWTEEEDAILRGLVAVHGEGCWSAIARALNAETGKPDAAGRIGKQCRERWNHHLKPGIRTGEWTEEEEAAFVAAHMRFGNRWSDIARALEGRSENACKNKWNATLRRKDGKAVKGMPVTLKNYMQQLMLLPPGAPTGHTPQPSGGHAPGSRGPSTGPGEEDGSDQGSRADAGREEEGIEEEEEGEEECGGWAQPGPPAKRCMLRHPTPLPWLTVMDAGSRRASESGEDAGRAAHSPATSTGAHSCLELRQSEHSPSMPLPARCTRPVPVSHPALALGLPALGCIDPNNQQHHQQWALPMWLPLQLGQNASDMSGGSQSPEHSTWMQPSVAAAASLHPLLQPHDHLAMWALAAADMQAAMGRAALQGMVQRECPVEEAAEQADVLAAEIMLALKAVPAQ